MIIQKDFTLVLRFYASGSEMFSFGFFYLKNEICSVLIFKSKFFKSHYLLLDDLFREK
jgi:hypothetical protein